MLDESHIRVNALAALLQILVAFLIGALLTEDLVRQDDGGRSGDTLHTVDIDLTALASSIRNEINSIVENTRDVLTHVVL